MGHVFSLEAIATCEQRGHEFAWVQTWHDVGFDECSRCGMTTTMPTATAIVPGSTVDESDSAERATSSSAAGQSGHAVPGGAGCESQAVHQVERVSPRAGRASQEEAGTIRRAIAPVAGAPGRNRSAGSIPARASSPDLVLCPLGHGVSAGGTTSRRSCPRPTGRTLSKQPCDSRGLSAAGEQGGATATAAPATSPRRRRSDPAKAARNEEIRRRRRNGESLASLAAAFGVHATRICQICKQGDTYKP